MDGLFLTSRRHWWERENNTVIEFHPSNTSGSRWARTRIARLVGREANDCAISPPQKVWKVQLSAIHFQVDFPTGLMTSLAPSQSHCACCGAAPGGNW